MAPRVERFAVQLEGLRPERNRSADIPGDQDLFRSGGQDPRSPAQWPQGSKVTADSVFYVLIFSLLAVVLVVSAVSTITRRRRNLEHEEAEMAGDPDRPDQP